MRSINFPGLALLALRGTVYAAILAAPFVTGWAWLIGVI